MNAGSTVSDQRDADTQHPIRNVLFPFPFNATPCTPYFSPTHHV